MIQVMLEKPMVGCVRLGDRIRACTVRMSLIDASHCEGQRHIFDDKWNLGEAAFVVQLAMVITFPEPRRSGDYQVLPSAEGGATT
jgi:hypothetical protein